MTLSVKQGSFVKSTSTGVPVTQNITGLGFTPKCIWMYSEGSTATAFEDNYIISYGFSDGSANGCITGGARRTTISDTGGSIRDDSCIALMDPANPDVVLARGKVTGFSSGQVSFQWDVNTAVASIIHYTIIGGTDITNVKVLSTTTGTTSTGNKGYTGVGFLPDFAQVINGSVGQTTINAATNAAILSIGTAKSTTERWVMGGHGESGVSNSSDDYTFKETAKFIASWAVASGNVDMLADFVSFDTDGLTVNYSDAPGSSTQRLIFLCIKGGLWDVGNFTKNTSPGTQDVTITTARDPEALHLFSCNDTVTSSGATGEAHNRISIGGTDGTTEGTIFSGEFDANSSASAVSRVTKTDKVIILATEHRTSSSSTVNGDADISDMATTGKFQLNWTTANATAYVIFYWVVSVTGAAPTNYDRPLTAETISISEVSLTRLYTANRAPAAQTTTITESVLRDFDGVRVMSTETVTVGESQTRVYGVNRAPTTETVTIGENLTRLLGANRALSTETITIGESLTRLQGLTRALTAETIAISESLVRVFGVVRTLSDTTVIGESLSRILGVIRVLSDTSAISESLAKVQTLVRSLSDTSAISESLTKILTLVRNLSDTSAISESLTRAVVVVRALATQTVSIGESLSRLFGANRTLSDTTVISESLARTFGVVRSLSDTTAISESLIRIYNAMRSLSDTSVISESLAKMQVLVRSLSDTTAISENLARILGFNRSLSDTTTIGESLTRVLGAIRALVTQTTTIGESLTRVLGTLRSLSDTTIISESLTRLLASIRSLSDTTVITGIVDSLYTPVGGGAINYNRSLSDTTAISETLARSISNVRSLIETTVIGESLSRILGVIRSLTDTTIISESLVRILSLTRSLSDTTTISESLTKVYGAIRNLSDTTAISESLNRLLGLIRSLSDTTIISESLSRIQGLTRALTDTTAISESLTRVYGILKSLSDTTIISDSIARSVVLVRNLIESVTILESLIRVIIREITDYVPSLETDFKDDIDKMILPYIFAKWNATGQLQKGSNMIDANSPVEFKVGIHSSRPYQVLALEQQTEINKISINKFGGGVWRFFTNVEVTVMVQRLQRDIPIELSQMEKEIQRIICHYTRDEIVGIDDLILLGMRREWTGTNKDWSKSIWSTKIYLKVEYQKVNTEIMNINAY